MRTSTGSPIIGSDPGERFVYIGQENGPPYRLTVEEAQDIIGDLVRHLVRAVSGDPA